MALKLTRDELVAQIDGVLEQFLVSLVRDGDLRNASDEAQYRFRVNRLIAQRALRKNTQRLQRGLVEPRTLTTV